MNVIMRAFPPILFDYDTPVESKVLSGGIHTSHITQKNFPCGRRGKQSASPVFINFGEKVRSSDEAARRIRDELHLRPGAPTELADISLLHPRAEELACYFPLVAVEVMWQNPTELPETRYVVYLRGPASEQQLYLLHTVLPLLNDCWFLAFRE